MGLFLLLGGAAALPFFLFQTKTPPSFEVQNWSGTVEVFSPGGNSWVPVQSNVTLGPGDKIRTGSGAKVNLQVTDHVRLRLKENSQLEGRKSRLLDRKLTYRLHLLKGILMASTGKAFKKERMEVSTPVLVAAVRGTDFSVESNPETQESWVGVFKGEVKVRAVGGRKIVKVGGLEKTSVKGGAEPLIPTRISYKEWNRLKEIYELSQKSAAFEARQLDLSRESGSLFVYVFDHGTFYTPQFGFADREFIKDETTGKVHLEIRYDVFPAGSFSGMYIKTRNVDLFKFKALEFEVRGDSAEGYPSGFRIELKYGRQIFKAFNPRDITTRWQKMQFPIQFHKPTQISEVTLVLSNEKAGTHKKGVLLLKDINLIPAETTA